jgi:tetratricopeptide (TPR) repeat protein
MPALIRPVDELGFPIPTKFDDLPAGAGEPRRAKPSVFQRFGRWRWAILILVPLLLFGRQLVDFGRGLVANFQVHRAERDWLRGDVHRALDHVDQAVAWEPDAERKADVIFFRAELHDELGDLDAAMGDYNQVIALLTDGKPLLRPSVGVAEAHDRRAYLHERLGHHREALDDSKEALVCCPAGPPLERAKLLNDHAYMCALAQMELPSGEHDIEEAIQIAGNDPAYLDTRGYVRFRLAHYDAALDDMQMAIRIEEGQERSGQYDERDLRLLHRYLAVMYHHRGEIYEKLGDDEKNKDRAVFKQKAEIDFHRADQLGFDPKNGVF